MRIIIMAVMLFNLIIYVEGAYAQVSLPSRGDSSKPFGSDNELFQDRDVARKTPTKSILVNESFFLLIPRPGGSAFYWDWEIEPSPGQVEIRKIKIDVLRDAPLAGGPDGDLFEIRGLTPGVAVVNWIFRTSFKTASSIRMEVQVH